MHITRVDSLSATQRETLALIAAGLSNISIARRLVIEEHSVEKRISSLYMALDMCPGSPLVNRRVIAANLYKDYQQARPNQIFTVV